MKYAASGSLLVAALLSSGVYGAPQAQPSSAVTMNTPSNLVACQPVMLTWSGGTAPYFLSLQDGNNFNGEALQQFTQQSTTSMSWTVTVPSGKSVAFLLRDSAGQTSLTAPVTVQKGSEESCVDNNLSFAPASATSTGGAPSGTSGATSIVTIGGPTQAAPTQSRASSSSSSPSKSAAVASTSSNAAAPNLAVSGVVLPALAALFGIIMA